MLAAIACTIPAPVPVSNEISILTGVDHILETRATGGKVSNSAIAQKTINNQDGILVDYYKQYNGNGSVAQGWPPKTSWISFMDMFNNSKWILQQSCNQYGFADDSAAETTSIYNAIETVAAATFVDHRLILAVMLQESGGCVRVPTTNGGVNNPGIMQSHDGPGTCWAKSSAGKVTAQNPCPAATITQMISDGTAGTPTGDGLAQCLNEAGTSDVSAYYRAARIYNSGSVDSSGDLGKGVATHCYASDIANRLTGWVQYPKNCTLDGAKPATYQ